MTADAPRAFHRPKTRGADRAACPRASLPPPPQGLSSLLSPGDMNLLVKVKTISVRVFWEWWWGSGDLGKRSLSEQLCHGTNGSSIC